MTLVLDPFVTLWVWFPFLLMENMVSVRWEGESSVEELVNKTDGLTITEEDLWDQNKGDTEDFLKIGIIGRIFSKRKCNRNFIKTVFGRIRETTGGWDVRVLEYADKSTFAGFPF